MARWAGCLAGYASAAGICVGMGAAPAEAGAWTKPRGQTLMISTQSVHYFDRAPGGISQSKQESSVYIEHGWRDHVTLVGRAALQSIDRSAIEPWRGVGGVEAGARLRLYRTGPWAASVQATVSAQTGGENRNNAALGEGGGDLDVRLMAGRSFGRSTFVDVQTAWRRRPGGAADELRLDVTAGTHVWRGARVMGQSFSVWSTGGPDGIDGYASHRLQGSVIWPLTSRSRMQIGAMRTASAHNTGVERSAFVSVWRTF
jgi:protein XagA